MQADYGVMRSAFAPYTRRELVLLGVVVAAGASVRLWALSQAAVEHFDEGVYASNVYFGEPDFAYPLQRLYAPPLLPALIETAMIAGLPPNVAALLPSFLAGCGTIVALWWVGRSWFGPAAGISAATLAALSDFHICFSAAALTDALLGLWLVLAVDAMGRSIVAGTLRVRSEHYGTRSVPTTLHGTRSLPAAWAVVAGLYTGLAWWTKYNGWLPLAIAAAALPLLWWLLRPPPRQLLAWLGCFAITAAVAIAVWSPYYFSLQSQGGYGPIAANHAKYVVGLAGWFDAAARHIASQYVIEGPLSKLAIVAAVVLPGFLARGLRGGLSMFRIGILACVLAVFLTSFVVVGVAGVIGLARQFLVIRRGPMQAADEQRHITWVALVGVWWAGLLVATPLYTAYPRLALPWLLAAWLGAGLNCAPPLAGADPLPPAPWKLSRRGWLLLGILLVALGIYAPFVLPHDGQFEFVADRRGLMQVAQEVRQTADPDEPRAIYVYAEPGLYFQLRAAGESFAAPIGVVPTEAATRDGRPAPTFLITGPHAHRDRQFHEQWSAAGDVWELVQSYDYAPSSLVQLDLDDPRQPAPPDAATQNQVRLYRLRP